MARKKEMYLIIDTETCNTMEQPMAYDIGYVICDRYGDIVLERSFVVAEVFIDMADVMKSAYYAEKLPKYWEDLKNGKRVMKSLFNIRRQMLEDIKAYNVKTIGAYNMGFDKRALNCTTRFCSQSFMRWFFPYGMKYICIWHMACQTLLNTSTYVKFAEQNGLVSEKNNLLTSAESTYKFLKKNVDFVESHTGLEDVQIEVEIMAKCFATHKKWINQLILVVGDYHRKKEKKLQKGVDISRPL